MGFPFTFSRRIGVVYAGALIAACLLTEIVGGLVGGLAAGYTIARSPDYHREVAAFLEARGLDAGADAEAVRAAFAALSPEDRAELGRMSTDLLRTMNWFGLLVLISALTYGPVGALSGWLAREWWPAGLVPVLTLFINNPLVRFPMAGELALPQRAGIVLLQITVSMGAALLITPLARRRLRGANLPTAPVQST